MSAKPADGIVTLRALQPSDKKTFASYGVSSEIARMYGGDTTALLKEDPKRGDRWFKRMSSEPCAWIIEVDGQPVGEIRLHSLDEQDQRARLALGMFGEQHLGKGIGRKAIRLALDYAFDIMMLHRVDLRVLAFNVRAIRCYLACGFVHEGTERDSARISGEWHDDWIMSILADEHRSSQIKPGAR